MAFGCRLGGANRVAWTERAILIAVGGYQEGLMGVLMMSTSICGGLVVGDRDAVCWQSRLQQLWHQCRRRQPRQCYGVLPQDLGAHKMAVVRKTTCAPFTSASAVAVRYADTFRCIGSRFEGTGSVGEHSAGDSYSCRRISGGVRGVLRMSTSICGGLGAVDWVAVCWHSRLLQRWHRCRQRQPRECYKVLQQDLGAHEIAVARITTCARSTLA